MLPAEDIRDPLTGVTVAVGVAGGTHAPVGFLVFQKLPEIPVDDLLVGAHQLQRARGDALGALGGVAHHEYGLAQTGRLLLDAAGVREDQVAAGQEVVEIQNLQRLDDVDALLAAQNFVGSLAHHGVHVDGIDGLNVGMLVHHPPDRPEHVLHGLAQILPPVGGNQDQTAALCPAQLGMGVVRPDGGLQGVDGGVAGDIDAFRPLALVQEVLLRQLRGSEVILTDDAHSLTVEVLGVRGIDIVGPQSRLHMAHGDLQIEAGQGGDKGGGGVAVDQDHIGFLFFQHLPDAVQNICGNIKEGLLLLHDGQVVVRHHMEGRQHLVEHLPVLTGDADDGLQIVPAFQLIDQGTHFNRFGTSSEDKHDLFHRRYLQFYIW